MFKFYGCDLYPTPGSQLSGECPFLDCRSRSHSTPINFFVNSMTGLWDCKVCGRAGNAYDFIRFYYEDCLRQTTDKDYEDLAAVREGISPETFKHHGVCFSYITNECMIPAYSHQRKKLINLYVWRQEATRQGPVMVVKGGPGFKQVMFGLANLGSVRSKKLWIAEGPWDFYAMWELFKTTKTDKHHEVLGCPGTNIPDEDLPLLNDRDLIFCGDNDAAGQQMVKNACKKLGLRSIRPSSIRELYWSPGTDIGYDTRDLIKEHGPEVSLQTLIKNQRPVKIDLSKAASASYGAVERAIP